LKHNFLLLKNCSIFDNPEILQDILIRNGKIEKIGNVKETIDSKSTIDISGKTVIPGIIDPHVHFREPGLTHKEDWTSGSIAAASGGVTTVLSMPNTIPPVITVDILEKKRRLAEKSIVNYGFHFGCSSDNNINEIRKVHNIASTKIFLNHSTGDLKIENPSLIEKIFNNSRMITLHAESDKIPFALDIAKKSGKKTYFCHLSSKNELDTILLAKNKRIFTEVTPHHLFLHNGPEINQNPRFFMYPTLKKKEDNNYLLNALSKGLIDCIGSDHAPHTLSEKELNPPPAGIPGIQTLLPLMLDAVNKDLLSLETIVRCTSENPAKIFGIKDKGKIAEGYDADIVVCDMEFSQVLSDDKMYSKCRWTPYNGLKIKGFPVITIVNGIIKYYFGAFNMISAREVIFEKF